ncbi:uncharacterized protein PFL1_00213 [Pseudozyma flocculosa PF-1]|uniref:Quinate transporter n=1 Tax=Pseudozyma flocculosa TaxID=84751 RepID=A0A5C3EVE7_9BASI|nr:uncharacterized protein PFL1_00213 [Pseudozyma flocculosa PF-1]EPQ32015.1 hypothetical protein PFL1_00213 [Pseudozyma flocculosa PF-1]SPO35061.1 related to monosaccharide transporter [Pseudozyma flocculosa]
MGFFSTLVRPPHDTSAVPAPPETHNWRLYTMAFSASMASAMFGYDSAFIGGALTLPSFKRTFGVTAEHSTALSSHITSLFQAGCFFGAILVYPITEQFGRKPALLLAGIVFSIGAIIQTVSDGNLGMMYAGRVLTGLGVGSSSLITPAYISECSTPATRGRLVGIFECCLQAALVVGFWTNYGVAQNIPDDGSNKQWQVPFAVQLIPAGLLLIAMTFQSESPRWLIKKGKDDKAREVLARLRDLPASHAYLSYEIESVRDQIHAELGPAGQLSLWGKLKECVAPENRVRLGLGVALMWLQNLSGINALNYFSNTLIKSIGFTGTSVSLLATGIFGIVKMVVTIVFMFFFVDRVGRRVPLLVGSVGAAASMYYLGIYSTVTRSFQQPVPKDGAAYFALVCVYLFGASYAFSWNGIPWIFQSEVFPLAVRALSMVVTTANQWLSQFVIVYSAPYMIESMRGYTFIFFALWTTAAFGFVWLLVPETAGISLENMDVLFDGPTLARDKRRHYDQVMASQRAMQLENEAEALPRERRQQESAAPADVTMDKEAKSMA